MKKVEKLRGSEFESESGAKGTWIELPYEVGNLNHSHFASRFSCIDFSFLQISYQGNEFSMVLILPEVRHTLDSLIRQLTSADMANIIGQLEDPYKRLVYLKMPKFSIQSSFSLTNVLLKVSTKSFLHSCNLEGSRK